MRLPILLLSLALASCGPPAPQAVEKDPLESTDQAVRDQAAAERRKTFKPSTAASWQPLLDKLKEGLSEAEVRTILGPSKCPQKPGFAYMNGQIFVWRLDDSWSLKFEIGRFEPGLRNKELVAGIREYFTQPPAHFTGVWRDYFASGVTSRERTLVDGHEEGTETFYYDDGKIRLVRTYVNGGKDYTETSYYPSGHMEQQGTYKDGHQVGAYTFYKEDGTVLSRQPAE